MKISILASLLALLSAAPAFAQGDNFSCFSRMFRDAKLEFAKDYVLVKDSHVGGSPALGEAIEKMLGLGGIFRPTNIQISVDTSEGVRCDSSATFLVNCQGRSQRASLAVEGKVLFEKGGSELVKLQIPVEVTRFELQTGLQSNGPISLGGTSTTVRLENITLRTEATILLYGQEIALTFSPFFKNRDSESSGCKKL